MKQIPISDFIHTERKPDIRDSYAHMHSQSLLTVGNLFQEMRTLMK
jgi:hypothetical protein